MNDGLNNQNGHNSHDGFNGQKSHDSHKGFDSHNGHDDQDNHSAYNGQRSIKRLWLALIGSDGQVNAMHPAYVKKLGFKKNDESRSKTFGMVIALFAPGQAGKGWFFQKTFLVADTRMEMVWSWRFFSSPLVVQIYGLQKACLKDLYNCRQLSGRNM